MPTVHIPEMPKVGKVSAREMQVFWDQFFVSADYRTSLKDRILKGKAPHMEVLLHHMVYGKPKETLELQGGGDGEFTLIIAGVEVKRQVLADGTVRQLPAGEQTADETPTPRAPGLVLELPPGDVVVEDARAT